MILKRLLVFNLFVATLFIVLFYFKFHIRLRAIPVHLMIVAYGLVFTYICGIISAKYFSKKVATIAITFILIVYHLFMLNMYLGFYIAHENWGHPLTINILIVYLNELSYLIDSLPFKISKFLIFIVLSVILGITSIPFILKRKALYNAFKKLSLNCFTKKQLLLGFGFYVVFPILFFSITWFQDRVKYDDPVVAFFLYEFNPQNALSINDGQHHFVAKENYPDNLDFNKKHVILIICDALRYDHLGHRGNFRNVTPFLDSLVTQKNAANPLNFYATSSRSFIGISNTLSSNYEIAHQNFFIHDLLKKQGYTVNFLLSGDHTNFFGLKKFYGKHIDFYQDGYVAKQKMSGRSVNDDLNIINTLDSHSGFDAKTPSFFYMHFMSSHELGIIDPKFKHYSPNKYERMSQGISSSILINDYDNRMAQLDQYLENTLNILKQKGYLENAIVVITSDHGQALGELDMTSHGNSTYSFESKIPMILLNFSNTNDSSLPDNMAAFNNQIDIAPTIVDLLGIPKPKTWVGRSIFKSRTSDYVFQQEQGYYSCIWKQKDSILQYVYNRRKQSQELFNITIKKAPQPNIIESFTESDLIKVKDTLSSFYNLEIK